MTVFVLGLWLSMQIGTGKEYRPDLPPIVTPILLVFLQCSLHGRKKRNSRTIIKIKENITFYYSFTNYAVKNITNNILQVMKHTYISKNVCITVILNYIK